VVISDCTPPDGTWKEVFEAIGDLPVPPPLIVSSRFADESLWAEVLNYGGYDLLRTPFRTDELVRTLSLAWRHGRDEHRAKVRSVGLALSAR